MSDSAAGRQVGEPAVEAGGKNSPGQPTLESRPRPGLGLGSRSYSGAWESHTPWRKVSSLPAVVGLLWSLPSLQRKEGRAREG